LNEGGEMSLDDVVAELLAGSLNEFTSQRNARVKELKGAGEGELAATVGGLKKPSVAVWAANQLARRDKAAFERLRRAGDAVVQAQSGAVAGQKDAAQALRSASDGLQRELEAEVRAAGVVLRAVGHAADEATLRRVQEILRLAAVSGGETWDRLERGALISEPRAGEDMLTAAFGLSREAGTGIAGRSRSDARPVSTKSSDVRMARAAAKQAAETEKRIAVEQALRTVKMDEQAAQQAEQTARRLREEAGRLAADAKRANDKARQAEREFERAAAKLKASREAARRLGGRR
jgi:hypothetical protein